MGATDGAGITGDAIGTTIMPSTTTSDITRKAGRFITATDSIEANTPAVISITLKELHSPQAGTANAHRVTTTVPKERHSLPAGKVKARAALKTVPPQRSGPLKETTTRLEDTLNLAVRAEFGRAPSTGTVMVERNAAFRRAEAPASAAEEGRVVAVAGTNNPSFVRFVVFREI
jgi:hypothetical protein